MLYINPQSIVALFNPSRSIAHTVFYIRYSLCVICVSTESVIRAVMTCWTGLAVRLCYQCRRARWFWLVVISQETHCATCTTARVSGQTSALLTRRSVIPPHTCIIYFSHNTLPCHCFEWLLKTGVLWCRWWRMDGMWQNSRSIYLESRFLGAGWIQSTPWKRKHSALSSF